jgi:hypothetical protein
LAQLKKSFGISAIPKAFIAHILRWTDANAPVRSPPPKGRKSMTTENDMTTKITAILAAAVVLGSAGVASAQPNRHARAQWQAPYANSYNQDTRNLRFGHANDYQFNPLAGTVFDGVAPY